MTLKSFKTIKELSTALNRKHRDEFLFIAYGTNPSNRYKLFKIPKKSSGLLSICAPNKALLNLQREILALLQNDYYPKAVVHGFVNGKDRSIKSNAESHICKKWVLNIDLKDYFETIHFGRIKGRLISSPYNYPPDIAQFIAHISCFEKITDTEGKKHKTSVLMQGSALSPILANIVSDKLDAELFRFCNQLGCTYTRYADDITISSDRSKFPAKIGTSKNNEDLKSFNLSETFQEIFENNGFNINHTKTRLRGRSFQQEVTGLVVNEKLNVKRKFVRNVRAMLHDWEANGLDAATSRHFDEKRPTRGRLPQQEVRKFEWVVHGKIEHIRNIKGPTDQVFRRLAAKYNDVCSNGSKFKIPLVEDREVLEATVWYLENDDDAGSVGTCFAIENNLFVTCAHCIGDNLRIFSPLNRNFALKAELVKKDDHNDLALIKITDPFPAYAPTCCLKIADKNDTAKFVVDSYVLVAGYPQNSDSNSLTIRESKFTGHSRKSFDRKPVNNDNVIELVSGTWAGMSGGPILFGGKVVGIIVRGPNDDDPTIPCLATKSELLEELLIRHPPNTDAIPT